MKIGVFDSGIGGQSIANSLTQDFLDAEIMYVQDSEHVPYGGREETEIIELTEKAIQPLLESNCDCIVLACNTASAAAIEYLRERYPQQKFVGLEPMIKPAAKATKSNVIAVCATPYTLSSQRYARLKKTYASDITVLEPDCSDWAEMIEHNTVDDVKIERVVTDSLEQGADVIVLACTHYHWIKEKIVSLVGDKAIVLEPSEAISRRVASILDMNFVA